MYAIVEAAEESGVEVHGGVVAGQTSPIPFMEHLLHKVMK